MDIQTAYLFLKKNRLETPTITYLHKVEMLLETFIKTRLETITIYNRKLS